MPKVLIADNISDVVCEIFDKYNIYYEKIVGLSEDELSAEIKGYDDMMNLVEMYFNLQSWT